MVCELYLNKTTVKKIQHKVENCKQWTHFHRGAGSQCRYIEGLDLGTALTFSGQALTGTFPFVEYT